MGSLGSDRPVGRGLGSPAAALTPLVALPPHSIGLAIGGAWLIVLAAQATGGAALLHHHALIEGSAPLWIALPVFLLAW
ncbi:MAG: hypothetical protein ACXWOW_06455 [Candidatus Limnocylindrales bacterium]